MSVFDGSTFGKNQGKHLCDSLKVVDQKKWTSARVLKYEHMKHIVVPTDFSSNAQKALDFAVQLARKAQGAHIHIVHAFSLLENVFIDRKALRDAWNEEQKKEKQAQLDALVQGLLSHYPTQECSAHLYSGPVVDVVIDYCNKVQASMVVMGTQGASGLAEVFIGSNTSAIIARTSIPVLAVPKEFEGTMPTEMVLAVRHFAEKEALSPMLPLLCSILNLPVIVVVFEPYEQDETVVAQDRQELQQYAQWLKEKCPALVVQSLVIKGENFEERLQSFCNINGQSILAMITHKRSFWEQLYAPSLTRKMAYHTCVPLLALPSTEI